jgi:hypothetical protein
MKFVPALCLHERTKMERIEEKRKQGPQAKMPETPVFFGEPCRDRTDNLLIKSQLLYQLS